MSDWTYIRGVLELSTEPFEQKKMKHEFPWHLQLKGELTEEERAEWDAWRDEYMKKSYLPFPEEQFKLDIPDPIRVAHKPTKKNPQDFEVALRTSAKVFSLPKARKYLKHAFSLLPQGETGFKYAIKQEASDCNSSSYKDEHVCLKKYYQVAINKLYCNDDPFREWDFDSLVKYRNLDKECSTIGYVYPMTLGISESLRWCTAAELQHRLEEFFIYLVKNDFELEEVYLEWYDNIESDLRYRCVTGYGNGLRFEKVNKNTGKVVYSKVFDYPRDENGYIDYNSKEYNTKEFIVTETVEEK